MSTATEDKTAWSKDEAKIKAAEDKAKAEAAKPVEPPKPVKAKVTMVDNVVDDVEDEWIYPFLSMKPGQGFFVANEPNQTTAQTGARVGKQVASVNNCYMIIEVNEDGDEVWEDVYVRTTKRNADGSQQLDSGNRPIVGHDPVSRPNIIYSRRYAVRQIAKDDLIGGKKAESDGVLVIRVV